MDDHLTSRLNHWYSARKVFVTGHTGFKGAWLVAWLRAAGAVVTGYALPAPPGRRNLFELAGLESGITSHLADICDRDALEGALRQSDADVVFHLAAQSLVRQSYLDPVETYRTNVLGTAQLLDVVRRAPSVRAVVIVTSDKCYENDNTSHRYTEADAMGGHDPYSSSKGCAELVTAAFRSSFFAGEPTSPPRTGIASARAGNVIGPGDWAPHRIMPDLMTAAENGTQAFVRNPTAVRPWQFVLEPLRGYLMLGSALANGGAEFASAWNFGPADEDAISVARLADGVRGTLGKLEVVHEKQDPAPHEAHVLRLDSSKAEQRLGWRPVLSLPRAIEISVRGYQQIHRAPSEASATMTSILEAYWSDVDAAT